MSINNDKNPRSVSGYIEGYEEAKSIPQGFCNELGYSTIEQATTYAENGKCQLLLLLVSMLGIYPTSAFPTIVNLKLDTLVCQYELTYDNRKTLNNVVCLCLMIGGIASSLIADTVSRKWTLIANLVLNATGGALMTFTNHFKQFLYVRALLSFTSSSITAIIVAHFSEFLLPYYRGSLIASLQIGWLLGVVTVSFVTDLWRYQAVFTTVPSLLSAFLFLFFPESPMFLLSRNRSKDALRALQFIFSINTGKTMKEYPIRHLIDNRNPSTPRRQSVVKHYISPGLEPKFICTPILMLSQCMFMFSYCTVTFWFPIMNQRLPGIFPLIDGVQIPQDCVAGFIVSPKTVQERQNASIIFNQTHPIISKIIYEETLERLCDKKSEFMFSGINVMTNAITCMPIMIVTILKIDRIGRKFFIMLAHFIAACLTYGSFYMHSFGKDLFFACIFDSVLIVAVAVSQCLAVELLPTRIRVFGISLVSAASSLGLIYAANGGILVFNLTCIVLLAMCGIGLEISGIVLMNLPDTAGINLR